MQYWWEVFDEVFSMVLWQHPHGLIAAHLVVMGFFEKRWVLMLLVQKMDLRELHRHFEFPASTYTAIRFTWRLNEKRKIS